MDGKTKVVLEVIGLLATVVVAYKEIKLAEIEASKEIAIASAKENG